MKKLSTTVKHYVPEWEYCNYSKGISPTKEKCRFCVKHGKDWICLLHNLPLSSMGDVVYKVDACQRQTVSLWSKGDVDNDKEPEATVTKKVLKAAVMEYRKMYCECIQAGVGDKLAHTIALDSVVK